MKKIENLLYANLNKCFVFFFIAEFVCDIFGGHFKVRTTPVHRPK